MQQHMNKRKPATSLNIGTNPSLEKRVATASMGAKKSQMSRTPLTLETMTSDENRIEKDVNNGSIKQFQNNVHNPYMHESRDTQHMEQSSTNIHVERELRQNHRLLETSSDSEGLNKIEKQDTSVSKGKSSKPRRRNRSVVPNWPENVNFDEVDEVFAYDADGKGYLVKGPVQPRDIWIDKELRYLVKFNDYNQPLAKVGSILVRFLGDVAKRESFCPVGYKKWHDLKKAMKADIVTIVRKLSEQGKEARASLAHTHFSGATSFSNRRLDLEKKKGTLSELDFYKEVYTKKDGSFKEGTISSQFLEDATTKVKESLASSSKSKVEV